MKWNDLAFWKKLSIAFGALLALLIVSSGVSYTGMLSTLKGAQRTELINNLNSLFYEKTIDHYRWLNKVDRVLLDGEGTRLGVQIDDHNCKLGAWLYGDGRRQAELAIPELAPLLSALEGPHARMHASAVEIDKVLADRNGANPGAVSDRALAIYNAQTLEAIDGIGQVMSNMADLLEKETGTAAVLQHHTASTTTTRIVVIALLALFTGIGFSLFMTRYLTVRINKLSDFSALLAEGDFTGRIDIDQKDEIGQLAGSLKRTQRDLSHMFTATIDEVVSLSSSSDSLFGVSRQLADGAENMTGRANTVAAAAEEMSSNMNSVAAASEQASTNVNMVAAATEEMTATVKDIAANSDKGRTMTKEAVANAESASVKVDELGSAAEEISKVTEVITEISEQTNLLALNATIEAARAGEAGKGFAVVANEIKELAKQTAEATQGIKAKVEGIQNTTSATVSEIEQITQVIQNVNDIAASIAKAVEEQSISTAEIAENVAQASQGIQEVNENVAQSSAVSAEIARDIAQVSRVSVEIKDSSDRVSGDAGNLSDASSRIKEMMMRFKIEASEVSSTEKALTTINESNVPDLINWDASIELGIKVFDTQHRRLVELINDLNRAMKLRKSREILTGIFAELVDYTQRHFGDEEKMMRQHDFNELQEHESQHKHFAEKMAEMQQQIKAGNAMVTMDLMAFLKDWLIKHIKGTDKQYRAFFKAKGVL
jgi:methyl-accepting chemotaxis protein